MRDYEIDDGKFKAFVRYLIQVAREKRCVTYQELQNVFGFSRGQVGYYAGRLGDLCIDWKWPRLNGLIINQKDCIPSKGFDYYRKECGKDWGEIVCDCWKRFHISMPNATKDYSGLDKYIDSFIESL